MQSNTRADKGIESTVILTMWFSAISKNFTESINLTFFSLFQCLYDVFFGSRKRSCMFPDIQMYIVRQVHIS